MATHDPEGPTVPDESWRRRLTRWGFNLFPAFRATGARLTHVADDWREVRVRLPLNWRTRNYVGTLFGGSMYGALDPVYMIMLIKTLGRGYVVWDKAASIRFQRPGRETLYATFRLDDADVRAIRAAVADKGKTEWMFCDGSKVVAVPGAKPEFMADPGAKRKPSGNRYLDAASKYPADSVQRAPKLPEKHAVPDNTPEPADEPG